MFKHIMVPLDGSELAECVLPYVEDFINQGQVESIVFVRVIKPIITATAIEADYSYIPEDWSRLELEKKSFAESYLKKIVARIKQDRVNFKTEVLVGRIADSLLDYIKANDFDLIVIATHGRSGLSRWVRGSIADKILSASNIPVLMIRPPGTMSERQLMD